MHAMKKAILAAAVAALPFTAAASPESYTIDPYHTYVNFEVDHLGFSRMRGLFTQTNPAKMTLDRVAKTGSIEITVRTASIVTGDNDKGSRPRARDEHLRSPDFFNVAEFPTMTFRSTKVAFKGDNPGQIDGNVTLLGVTKPASLTVDFWKCGQHPVSKREMCGGNASGTIKRTDFGMKYGVPAVGDEIKLFVEIEAYKD